MEKRAAVITYKVKVKQIGIAGETATEPYIEYKREIGRHDCDIRPHQHEYYNSDLFISMLKGAHKAATGGKQWCRLSQLPPSVAVDTSGFLAVVSVTVMV